MTAFGNGTGNIKHTNPTAEKGNPDTGLSPRLTKNTANDKRQRGGINFTARKQQQCY